MKTFWAAILIFAILIGGGIASNICLDRLSEELLDSTKTINDDIEEKNFEKAYEKSEKLSEFIDGKKTMMASILNHENIDIIEESVSDLLGYTKNSDLTEASVSIKRLEHLFEHLPENYRLELQNVL